MDPRESLHFLFKTLPTLITFKNQIPLIFSPRVCVKISINNFPFLKNNFAQQHFSSFFFAALVAKKSCADR